MLKSNILSDILEKELKEDRWLRAIFCTVPTQLNGVCRQVVCSLVRSVVRTFFAKCTMTTVNKRLDLEVPIFAHIWTLTWYVRLQIFIQIISVLDNHLQGQKFDSNTLANA